MKHARSNRRRSEHHWSKSLRRRLSLRTWLLRHAQVAFDSLGRLYRNWVSSLMTTAVLGIALSMPAGMYLLLDNLDRLSGSWDGQASLSVFLKPRVSETAAATLAETIRNWPEIAGVTMVAPAEALEEFGQHAGFADVLGALDENPLPVVLLVTPGPGHGDPQSAGKLQQKLRGLAEIELAQLDLQWVQRLAAMLEMARRGVAVISALLALAVLLVVGNTIRLEIQNRREEIVVTKLIGATNSFIRRPFLYSGIWYGVLGAGVAWLIVEISFWLLAGPVQHLAGLYQSHFALQTLPLQLLLVLLGSGSGLGLLGSWLAVGRHLSAIEPS